MVPQYVLAPANPLYFFLFSNNSLISTTTSLRTWQDGNAPYWSILTTRRSRILISCIPTDGSMGRWMSCTYNSSNGGREQRVIYYMISIQMICTWWNCIQVTCCSCQRAGCMILKAWTRQCHWSLAFRSIVMHTVCREGLTHCWRLNLSEYFLYNGKRHVCLTT